MEKHKILPQKNKKRNVLEPHGLYGAVVTLVKPKTMFAFSVFMFYPYGMNTKSIQLPLYGHFSRLCSCLFDSAAMPDDTPTMSIPQFLLGYVSLVVYTVSVAVILCTLFVLLPIGISIVVFAYFGGQIGVATLIGIYVCIAYYFFPSAVLRAVGFLLQSALFLGFAALIIWVVMYIILALFLYVSIMALAFILLAAFLGSKVF